MVETARQGEARTETAARSLLRNHEFQALWTSRFFANLGKETSEVAYPLLILALTGSAAIAGSVGAAQVITASLCALAGGALGDRFDRRWILMACDLFRLVLMALFGTLILTTGVNVPIIVLTWLGSAACLGMSNPIALAVVKQLVPPEQVSTAAAQNQIRLFGTLVIAPPVGGTLFGLSRAFPFLFEAFSYVMSTTLLLRIKTKLRAERRDRDRTHPLAGVADGFRFIARDPTIRPMMIWSTGFNLAFTHTGAFLALIAVAHSRGVSSSTIGVMISFAGFSGLIGAFIANSVVKRLSPSMVFLSAAWLAPTGAVLLALVPGVLPLGVILGLVFALVPSVNSLLFGYMAVLVPNDQQGRVMGAVSCLSLIAQPIGIFGVGALFDAAGPTWVFLAMAAVTTIAALPTLTRQMRRLPRASEMTVA